MHELLSDKDFKISLIIEIIFLPKNGCPISKRSLKKLQKQSIKTYNRISLIGFFGIKFSRWKKPFNFLFNLPSPRNIRSEERLVESLTYLLLDLDPVKYRFYTLDNKFIQASQYLQYRDSHIRF